MPRHSVAVSVNWSGKTSRYVAEERLGGEEMRRYISPPLRRRRYSVTCYVYGVPRISTKLFQVRLTLSEHVSALLFPAYHHHQSPFISSSYLPIHPPAVPPSHWYLSFSFQLPSHLHSRYHISSIYKLRFPNLHSMGACLSCLGFGPRESEAEVGRLIMRSSLTC